MMERMRCGFVGVLLVGVSSPALAQASGAEAPTAGDEIIVTAQRRSEDLSRTPVAVSVISGAKLSSADVTTANDLRASTPGLSVRSSTSSEQLNFAIRGNTQDPFSDVRPGVMPYFNDVQIGAPLSSGSLYDLQSVQVLKGPQGTLFGRSATGGTILFNSAKPSDIFEGSVSGLYGNYDRARVEAAVNAPLVADTLLLRLAGFYDRRDGYQNNLYTRGHTGEQEKYGFRPSFTAIFGGVTNETVVDYYKSKSENTVAVISGLLPFTGSPPPYVPAAFLYAGVDTPANRATGIATVQALLSAQGAPAAALDVVPAYYDAYFSDPRRPSGGLVEALSEQQAHSPYVINSDAENYANVRTTTITNTTSIDLGASATLKNIFGYVDYNSHMSFDADGTPFALSQQVAGEGLRTKYKGVTEELQLLGSGLDGALDYVVGAYFSSEKKDLLQYSQLFDILLGGLQQVNDVTTRNKTYAVYTQETYRFGDSGVSATAGVRYTYEKVSATFNPGDVYRAMLGPVPPAGFAYFQKRSDESLSWTLGLEYQVNSDLLVYLRNRRAFRSAGFNSLAAPRVGGADIGGNTYEPERVTDVELGAKFNGQLGSMPARFNFAAYHNWIKDSQRAAFGFVNGGAAALTVNAPKAKVYGIEFDGQVQPASWLTIGGVANATKAKFVDGNVFVAGIPSTFDQFPDTPKFSGMIFADVNAPINDRLTGTFHADVFGQSSIVTTPNSSNDVGTHIGGYALVNFRLGIADQRAGWSLTANLKNAFDRVYYVGGLAVGEIYQVNTLVPGEPRTYTLQMKYDF